MEHSLGKLKGNFSDNNLILNKLLDTCHNHSLSVIKTTFHNFSPQGYTAVILLAESHLSIHTYPEDQIAHVDLFCCNPDICTKTVLETLAGYLSAEVVEMQVVKRDNDNYSWRQ